MNKDNKLWEKILELKGFASVGVTDIVGTGMGAIFWFYIVSLIDAEQYGEISYFLGIAGVIQVIALVGTSNVITVCLAKKIRIESTLYFLSLVISFISSVIIFVLFYRIDVSLLIFAFVINDLAIATILGTKCYASYPKFIITQKVLLLVTGITLYHFIGVESIIFSIFISYVPFIIIMRKGFVNSKIDFTLLKQRKEFILNNYLIALTTGFRRDVDKLIIPPLLGFTILGNYALSLQFFSVLTIFSGILYKYILPEDASKNSNKKLKKFSIVFTAGIAIAGYFLLPEIVPWIFPEYLDTIDAIRIMSLTVIPSNMVLIFWSELLAKEKSRVVLISSLIQMIIMVLGIITLGPLFGIEGLAWTHLLSSSTQAIFLMLSMKFAKN